MKVSLRMTGETRSAASNPAPGAKHVVIAGACPLCAVVPFQVAGVTGTHRHDHDTHYAAATCIACGAGVGELVVKVETIFGIEEDQAVGQRARVYR